MKWVYVIAGLALVVKMLFVSNPAPEFSAISITDLVVQDSGVPNAVSGII